MTSTAKTSITADTSALSDGQTADAADVTTPIGDLLEAVKAGRLSISANDTHVKHLADALAAATGLSWAITGAGGDEGYQVSLDGKLVNLLAFLTAAGKLPATGIDSTGETSGDVLTANGSGGASWAPQGGGGATPVDVSATAGETLAERDMVYLNRADYEWYKVDADAAPPLLGAQRGCVNEAGGIANGSSGSIRLIGEVAGFSGLTAWAPVYAAATGGGYTQTKPTLTAGGGQVAVLALGFATSTTAIMIWPLSRVQYLKRASLAHDGEMTIEHHVDAQARERLTRAYVSSTVASSSLESYGSSNQDQDVGLKQQTISTYTTDQCSGGTASASSEYPTTGLASLAFDDSNSTMWQPSSGTTGWIKYDFGSGNQKTIVRVTIRAHTTYNDRCAQDFTIQASNNDADWDTLKTVTAETGWTGAEQRTFDFDNQTAYRYWKIDVTANDGGAILGIAEIEMLEVATWDNGNDQLAQSFQVTGAQTVGSVRLWLKKTASPSGNLTVKIETDSSGDPSGTAVSNGTSNTVAASTLAASYGWIEFSFSTPPGLSGSTTYWLVLETADSQSQTDYVEWGADGSSPSYSSGEMKSYVSATWSAESKDACFDVLGVGTSYEEPCAIRRWSSTSTEFDVALRYDDGSGADADAKTTFKNVSGATLDVTGVVELE